MRLRHWTSGLVTCVFTLGLAACGGSAGSPTSAPAAAHKLDSNATLRMILPSMPSTLHPQRATSEVQQFAWINLMYDRLTQMVVDNSGEVSVAPMLAKSWEYSSDGLSLTFHLRDDATFTDGTSVTAEAVKSSLDLALTDPQSTAQSLFSGIDSVAAPAPTTVVVTTKKPSADLPYLLSSAYGSIINPASLNDPKLDVAPDGSGAYIAKSVKAGVSVTLERRPDGYWDKNASSPKTIVLSAITDPNARLSSLQSGQADFLSLVASQHNAAKSLATGDLKLFQYKRKASRIVAPINQYRPYMSDVRVRQALNLGIDKQAILDTVLGGIGTTTDQMLGETETGFLDDLVGTLSYDPKRAKALLAEAGVPNDYAINLVVPNFDPLPQVATVLQAQLAEIGLKANIDVLEVAQAFTAFSKDSKYDMQVNSTISFETPRLTLANNFLTYRALLDPVPEEFLAALDQANTPELPTAELKSALETANRIASEQAFDIFITQQPYIVLHRKNIVGVESMGRGAFQATADARYLGVTK